jgi:hypothetical protein
MAQLFPNYFTVQERPFNQQEGVFIDYKGKMDLHSKKLQTFELTNPQ